MTSATATLRLPLDVSAGLPAAGPSAKPQLIEIDVAPWQRIAVLFRPVHSAKAEESGTIWYWRPESMARV